MGEEGNVTEGYCHRWGLVGSDCLSCECLGYEKRQTGKVDTYDGTAIQCGVLATVVPFSSFLSGT